MSGTVFGIIIGIVSTAVTIGLGLVGGVFISHHWKKYYQFKGRKNKKVKPPRKITNTKVVAKKNIRDHNYSQESFNSKDRNSIKVK